MYSNSKSNQSFPDPLAPVEKKVDNRYGLKYAKAIEAQWRGSGDRNAIQKKRRKLFEKNGWKIIDAAQPAHNSPPPLCYS